MKSIEEQNKLLKNLIRLVVLKLPAHSPDCGVFNAHPSYGNKYCDCKLKEIRKEVESILAE